MIVESNLELRELAKIIDIPDDLYDEAGFLIDHMADADEIFSKLMGDIVEVNAKLDTTPGLINSDPYGDGWLLRIQPTDEASLDELMSAEEYQELVEIDK